MKLLEVGKFYRTRGRKKAYVAAANCPFGAEQYDVYIGWIAKGPASMDGMATSWASDGRWAADAEQHPYDLVEEWRDPAKVSGWANVYRDGGVGCVYPTKKDAETAALVRDVIATVYVSGEEGKEP